MYIWKNIHRLVDRFAKPVSYQTIVGETYSDEEGLPVLTWETVSLMASIQPVKKKGAIGGENEIFIDVNADGNWEQGAFIMISKSDFRINVKDEITNLTINGNNYGDAFVERVQDWSDCNGHYKVKVLLKSIFPTREDFEGASDDNTDDDNTNGNNDNDNENNTNDNDGNKVDDNNDNVGRHLL